MSDCRGAVGTGTVGGGKGGCGVSARVSIMPSASVIPAAGEALPVLRCPVCAAPCERTAGAAVGFAPTRFGRGSDVGAGLGGGSAAALSRRESFSLAGGFAKEDAGAGARKDATRPPPEGRLSGGAPAAGRRQRRRQRWVKRCGFPAAGCTGCPLIAHGDADAHAWQASLDPWHQSMRSNLRVR